MIHLKQEASYVMEKKTYTQEDFQYNYESYITNMEYAHQFLDEYGDPVL